MLDAAGVEYRSVRPEVDEDAVKARSSDPGYIATELAGAKAVSIGGTDWVIGSDSVVKVGDHRFSNSVSTRRASRRFASSLKHLGRRLVWFQRCWACPAR